MPNVVTVRLLQPKSLRGVIFVKNVEIRSAYMLAGIKQWQLAEAMGISETHLSRKMRKELPQEEKKNILELIDRMAQEKQGVI